MILNLRNKYDSDLNIMFYLFFNYNIIGVYQLIWKNQNQSFKNPFISSCYLSLDSKASQPRFLLNSQSSKIEKGKI